MKPGTVLAADDALAQGDVAELGDRGKCVRRGVRTGSDFQQPHVARRIEEMGDQEIAAERLAHAVRQHLQRDGGGVGTDGAAGAAYGFQFAIQRLLDVGAFQHRFDDPVAVGQLAQVVFKVAGLDQPRGTVVHERRGFGLMQSCDRALGQRAAVVGAGGHDIKQHDRHAGIGDLCGDPGTHRTGADDTDFPDPAGGG